MLLYVLIVTIRAERAARGPPEITLVAVHRARGPIVRTEEQKHTTLAAHTIQSFGSKMKRPIYVESNLS